MRWLVSTLDALVTSLPEPEAERQRQRLSGLVMRYKELVPRLETTAGRLDGLAQCHSYRLEIEEVRPRLRRSAALLRRKSTREGRCGLWI